APKETRRFEQAQSGIYGLTITADGKRVLAAGGDEVFFVWDLSSDSDAAELVIGQGMGRTLEVRVIGGGTRFAGSSVDGSVKIWELDVDATRKLICEQTGTPLSEQFDPCA
ncbi:MAG: hypothetical protein Q4G46_15010, partial [Propionibacteriaceae bacterium]|nr:hypothetical protein [Propionibacteriaceae bacterium]